MAHGYTLARLHYSRKFARYVGAIHVIHSLWKLYTFLELINSFVVLYLVMFVGECNYRYNTSDPTEFIANMARRNGIIRWLCNVMYAERSSPVCIWRMLIAFPASSRLCDLVQYFLQLLVMILFLCTRHSMAIY